MTNNANDSDARPWPLVVLTSAPVLLVLMVSVIPGANRVLALAWAIVENGIIAIATYVFLIVFFGVFPVYAAVCSVRSRRALATRADLTPIERYNLKRDAEGYPAVAVLLGIIGIAALLVAIFQGPEVFLMSTPCQTCRLP